VAFRILLGVILAGLVVAIGAWEGTRAPVRAKVPGVVGLHREEASARLSRAHLVVQVKVLRSRASLDRVVAQSLRPGKRVRSGSKILLVVAGP
jgi:beta-lactam-binding protein with PASTA domain